MNVFFLLAMISCLCLASIASGDDTRPDAQAMEGTWLPESAELAGQKMPDEFIKEMKLTMKGDTYTVTVGPNIDRGKVKLDPSQKPRTLDITGTEGPNKDKTILAIYDLSKDSLKICYDLGGKERPAEFKTKAETLQFLVVYKREKP